MDSDVKLGWSYIITGLIPLFILIYFWIWDIIRGVKSVNGIVIGESPDTHYIYIRYKIKADTYHEIACPRYRYSSYFMLGPPHIGLKIVLKVRKDNPYKVVSIHTTLSKDGTYSNNYIWRVPLTLLSLSAFFMATGVVFVTGIL